MILYEKNDKIINQIIIFLLFASQEICGKAGLISCKISF